MHGKNKDQRCRKRKQATKPKPEHLQELFTETVALFHSMKAVAVRLHGAGGMTAGKRGVLLGLQQGGPQTVPQMARSRPVSRQHIQTLVNPLMEDGYVEYAENPAHKRSRLVCLTPSGEQALREMALREKQALASVDFGLSQEEILQAVAVLQKTRNVLAKVSP